MSSNTWLQNCQKELYHEVVSPFVSFGDKIMYHPLKEIDRHLDIIRKQGRQTFLMAPPENFSRILHDYSDDQKGFILWKDMLEERLV
jgi:hypothetical protein